MALCAALNNEFTIGLDFPPFRFIPPSPLKVLLNLEGGNDAYLF
jgi:hypothetical protein